MELGKERGVTYSWLGLGRGSADGAADTEPRGARLPPPRRGGGRGPLVPSPRLSGGRPAPAARQRRSRRAPSPAGRPPSPPSLTSARSPPAPRPREALGASRGPQPSTPDGERVRAAGGSVPVGRCRRPLRTWDGGSRAPRELSLLPGELHSAHEALLGARTRSAAARREQAFVFGGRRFGVW